LPAEGADVVTSLWHPGSQQLPGLARGYHSAGNEHGAAAWGHAVDACRLRQGDGRVDRFAEAVPHQDTAGADRGEEFAVTTRWLNTRSISASRPVTSLSCKAAHTPITCRELH
jgi:hypothetical protein